MKRKKLLARTTFIVVIGIFVAISTQRFSNTQTIDLTIFANPASKQGIETINQVAQAVNTIPGNYTIEIFPPAFQQDQRITFYSNELEELSDQEKTNILREISYLQKLQSHHQALLEYSTIRIDNIETTDWESLSDYASITPQEDSPQSQKPPEQIIELLSSGANILLVNNQVFDVNTRKTVFQLEQKLVQIHLRQDKDSLPPPFQNPILGYLSQSNYRHSQRFEAYTDLDCDDKSDQVGQVVGYKTPFQRCEYQTPEMVTLTILTQTDIDEIKVELETVKNLLTQILKKTQFEDPQRISLDDVIEPPRTSPEQESLPFQIIAEPNISQHPKFRDLQESGIIEKIEGQYFINIYMII